MPLPSFFGPPPTTHPPSTAGTAAMRPRAVSSPTFASGCLWSCLPVSKAGRVGVRERGERGRATPTHPNSLYFLATPQNQRATAPFPTCWTWGRHTLPPVTSCVSATSSPPSPPGPFFTRTFAGLSFGVCAGRIGWPYLGPACFATWLGPTLRWRAFCEPGR